jgi:hypothetical protein
MYGIHVKAMSEHELMDMNLRMIQVNQMGTGGITEETGKRSENSKVDQERRIYVEC